MGDNGAMSTPRRHSPAAVLALLGLLLIGFGAGYLLSLRQNPAPPETGIAIPPGLNLAVLTDARSLPAFRLQQHDGRPFTVDNLRGHWNVLFFGYTHCPDVCPLALQNLRHAWQQLQPDPSNPARPRAWFVSVDPGRDTPKLLGEYVTYFNPDFTGVTGPADEIDKLTGALGILYGFEDKTPGKDDYIVNHGSQMVFIDPEGRMRAVLSPPYDGDDIVRALRFLEARFGPQASNHVTPKPESLA